MLALVASIAVIVALLGSALTTEGEMTNDPESYRGYDAIAEHFPFDPAEAVNELVVVRSARATVDAPAFRKHVEDLEFELQASGHVESARDVYATGDRSLVSPDGHATVIPLFLGPSGEDGIGELVAIVDAAERDGFETAITGEFTADEDYQRLSEEDLQKGEFQFGIPAALIVLLLVFGSIVAGLVPVLTALKITEQIISNRIIKEAIANARQQVTDGKSLAEPLARSKIFPQLMVDLVRIGEETGATAGEQKEFIWLVDPHDGTFEFTSGKRGSSISVALLKSRNPVLGVVHAPLSPDRGRDTIAWAKDAGPIQRNGKPVDVDLSQRLLRAGELVFATASSALRPGAWSRACAPARYVAMPSIAYRLARVAAGDGVATVSIHGVSEYDVAAGFALIRAAGGVLLDAEGKEVALTGELERRLSGCFAGAPEAAKQLAAYDWKQLEQEPAQKARVALGFPRRAPEARVERAQGCLLGQVIGDSLGALVEFKSAAEIAAAFPGGVRELADGGVHHTIAGQPTDDSEMALALARSLVSEKAFSEEKVLAAYREWLQSRPVDISTTTERGLLGMVTTDSESNGSLMRVSPIGVWAAGDPARAAAAAREDAALTHKNPVCIEACAGYAAAIAVGVAGGGREAMRNTGAAENEAGHLHGYRSLSRDGNLHWVWWR